MPNRSEKFHGDLPGGKHSSGTQPTPKAGRTPRWVPGMLLVIAAIVVLANGYLVLVATNSQPECVAPTSSMKASSYKPARKSCQ